jgi:cation diffusion facilitator CzcD-associated flavoprotein CzcO
MTVNGTHVVANDGTEPPRCEVCIVGAGPSGLMLA